MIIFNPNNNLVSSTDGGSGAAWPTTLMTISGCSAGNTLFAVLSFSSVSGGLGDAPPPAPSGWILDSGVATAGTAGAPIGVGIYRKASAASGANSFSPVAPGGTSPFFWTAALFEVTALALDEAPPGVSSSAATLSGPNTGTLSNAVEFALGVCGANQDGAPVVPAVPSGFTSAFGETAAVAIQAAFQITSTTTAINPSWSSAGSLSMAAAITTYSAAGTPQVSSLSFMNLGPC
jgi:hypothetical protein